jgi:dipeptidyl aminopeptidase/acylaminoacyl peptidase
MLSLLGALLVLASADAGAARAPAAGAETAMLAAPDSLVVEGVPSMPASLTESVRPYTEFRGASFVSWHPDRREMVIATRFADTVQLHRVVTAGGARTQLTFFADRVASASYPRTVGTGRPFLVFQKDAGGNEFFQNFRLDTDGGAITLLTDGRSRNSLGVFSRSDERVAYTSTRRTGADTDLWVVHPRQPKSDRLLAEVKGGGWSILDWSPDGKAVLVREMISINDTRLWRFDVASGARDELTPRPAGAQIAYGDARFASDGRSILATTDRDSEFLQLVRIDIAGGKHQPLSAHIPWDIIAMDLSRDGRQLAVIANENGVGRVHLFDARTGKERKPPVFPPGSATDVGWHGNGRDLAVTMVSARMAADVFVLEAASGRVQRWTESELGGVDLRELPEPEIVEWRSFDGRKISGLLYRPPPRFTGRRPVMVNIHGGPEGQARPAFQGRNNYLLSEMGIAILFPNVRGSTGYGKTFTKLDNALLREDSVKDIGALLAWIPNRPELDPERVMVSGGSYGGYMSLAVSMTYADKIRCSVDVVGISNFVTFLERTEAYRRDLRRVEYGDERDPATRAFLERIAPVKNADKIRKPMLVAQGKNDPRVPLYEAEQMVSTLRKRGTPVWYLMARDEGHGFAKKRNADHLFYVLVTFIRKHLLDPLPGRLPN